MSNAGRFTVLYLIMVSVKQNSMIFLSDKQDRGIKHKLFWGQAVKSTAKASNGALYLKSCITPFNSTVDKYNATKL